MAPFPSCCLVCRRFAFVSNRVYSRRQRRGNLGAPKEGESIEAAAIQEDVRSLIQEYFGARKGTDERKILAY